VVLCLDEKSQVQALERSAPILPIRPGLPEKATHDYIRHGTTTLFAALEVATGRVVDACFDRHRHQEFLKFLKQVAKVYPAARDRARPGRLPVGTPAFRTGFWRSRRPPLCATSSKSTRPSSARTKAEPGFHQRTDRGHNLLGTHATDHFTWRGNRQNTMSTPGELPFAGVAHVGYLPDTRILGLSKLERPIDGVSRRKPTTAYPTIRRWSTPPRPSPASCIPTLLPSPSGAERHRRDVSAARRAYNPATATATPLT
jgi:hypothetical protein